MRNYKEEFPEDHPDVLPSDATWKAIVGVLMSRLGLPAIRITAGALREWRLKGAKITIQKNGSAILTDGSPPCQSSPHLTATTNG